MENIKSKVVLGLFGVIVIVGLALAAFVCIPHCRKR